MTEVTAKFIKDHTVKLKDSLYFVSGPPDMVEAIAEALRNTGVEQADINTDNFSGY